MLTLCAIGVRADSDVKTWLARAMVAECGWMPTDCQAATAHVLQRRAKQQKVTLVTMIRAYCAGLGDTPATARQTWIRKMHGEEEPEGWPAASWPHHSQFWLATLEYAQAFLEGKVEDPCHGKPTHFGGLNLPGDVERMKGRRRAYCGNTGRQGFWR